MPSAKPGHGATWRQRLKPLASSVILCGPAVALYVGFVVVPAALGFAYSFTRWTGWSLDAPFIGMANFQELLHDQRLRHAVLFTLFETAMIVVVFALGSMVLAVLLAATAQIL